MSSSSLSHANLKPGLKSELGAGFDAILEVRTQCSVFRMLQAHCANRPPHSSRLSGPVCCFSSGVCGLSLILFSTSIGILPPPFLCPSLLPLTWPCTRCVLHFTTYTSGDRVHRDAVRPGSPPPLRLDTTLATGSAAVHTSAPQPMRPPVWFRLPARVLSFYVPSARALFRSVFFAD